MPLVIHFITGSDEKVHLLQQMASGLDVEIIKTEFPVIEPQVDSVETVALSKASQAFRTLKEPVIAEDSGFCIEELSGFPGPYTRYVVGTIGVSGLLKLAAALPSRKCKFVSALAYIDSDGVPRTFVDYRDEGTLATEVDPSPCEEAWSDLWRIFIPSGQTEPLTALTGRPKHTAEEKWLSNSAFAQFVEWLRSKVGRIDDRLEDSDRLLSREFEFPIPRERIAIRPRPHGQHKLLLYERASGAISHHLFDDVGALLPKHTLIVINNSKVVKAALRKPLDDGTYVHVLHPQQQALDPVYALCPWKPPPGETIKVNGGRYIVLEAPVPGRDIRRGRIVPDDPEIRSLPDFLELHGSIPIPIYVSSERPPDESDKRDYQNCYAKVPGSIECPTAGLHFYPQLMDSLRQSGFEFVEVTLHIGYGTWKSFKKPFVDEHDMDPEDIIVPAEAIRRLAEAKMQARPVLAVGTSSVRTIESIATEILGGNYPSDGVERETSLFIYPGYKLRVADMLLTNFAYPRTPIMALAAAFCGLSELRRIFNEALDSDYLFYTYGDAILII